MADQSIEITSETLAGLAALRAEPKFHARPEWCYPGAPDEAIRLNAERSVNQMLDRLTAALMTSPTKAFVLSEFQRMLNGFEEHDTEEREQACGYCEQVMALLGIERSDGLLNRWLYGFDPNDTA
jgi:hypothetical protein